MINNTDYSIAYIHDDTNTHPALAVFDNLKGPLLPDMLYTFDSGKHYQHEPFNYLRVQLGVLVPWSMAIMHAPAGTTFKQVFNDAYPFGLISMDGGEIGPDGVYRYPEDEPLYPMAETSYGNEKLYFYPYAIVGTVNSETGQQWLTRLD